MATKVSMFSIILLLFVLLQPNNSTGFLVYPPAATSLGLVASVSVPVSEYFPERRILIDWCFTMSYDLPSSPSQFYSAPIWPGIPGTKGRRDLHQMHHHNHHSSYNVSYQEFYEKYKNDTLFDKRHPSDFTAGELYQGIEDFLMTYGFHETCLLRTVCELAHHPFDDRHQNIITDILTFFLTPSQHEGFDESELLYREVYEDAENRGFYGENCSQLYPDCHKDFLQIITEVILPNV